MENEKQKQLSSSTTTNCCISHIFQQIASTFPNKIAIINSTKHPFNLPAYNLLTTTINNTNPTLNNKEHFFTFSQLLSAIYSLTSKLNHIINGGDDPSLIKPTSNNINFNVKSKLLGVFMVPSLEYVITILSIFRIGVGFVPLDPFWPKERIFSVILSSNVDLIIGCSNFGKINSAHLLDESHWLVNCCKFHVFCVNFDGFFENDNNNSILSQRCGKFDLGWPCESKGLGKFSYLMYTSGSTGKPKGVCGTEQGVLNRFLWMQEFYPLNLDDVVLFKTSISFIDHLQEFIGPMLVGCSLVVPPFDVLKGDFYGIVDLLHNYSITRMTAVPSLMRALVPVLEGRCSELVECFSLKLLVLSGEVFPVSLWKMLSRIFPRTCILNIYGSTEVSGDCTYFDCGLLPEILEIEMVSSVPIGKPISNCRIELIEKEGKRDEGEICVSGICLSRGYYSDGNIMPLDYEELSGELYYRMGDFAKRLPSGDLVFCGREDRTIKVNGHRIALEEVEDVLRGHPDIKDAAVVFCNEQEGSAFLGAVLILKENPESSQISGAVKNWMMDRLPSVMIPKKILYHEMLPFSSNGKMDYAMLSSFFTPLVSPNKGHVECYRTLGHIKEAFCNSLDVAEVGNDDDFFAMGGDSLIAAHCAYNLGIDMRLLYMFPSPSKLQKALMEQVGPLGVDPQVKLEMLPKPQKGDLLNSSGSRFVKSRKFGETISNDKDEYGKHKHLKVDAELNIDVKGVTSLSSVLWESESPLMPNKCGISRCNNVVHTNSGSDPVTFKFELPRHSKGFLQEIWKVPLDSCVDASPLIIVKDNQILIFIGSHSHKFLCINARNGSVRWELKLDGRIECSAMVDGDFSQIIVGCYKGKIYFIDLIKGKINWTFQTGGEVKSQPALDKCRHLIWCGSYDHNIYGLDYRNHKCVYQFPCGGSIFGSPAVDEACHILYVGTTNGNLTAISLKAATYCIAWSIKLEAPVFGSLSISSNGNVLCCLVNGDVLSVNQEGSIIWRVKTDGPIFAGPCISKALDSQALICSRNGNVYSFELEEGKILWEYHVGDPITSSAYVDDNIKLISEDYHSPSERFVCICSSSGRIVLLRTSCVVAADDNMEEIVKKFAKLDLPGDIFSSPVMIGGRIFVGCRDDFLHCIVAESYPVTTESES